MKAFNFTDPHFFDILLQLIKRVVFCTHPILVVGFNFSDILHSIKINSFPSVWAVVFLIRNHLCFFTSMVDVVLWRQAFLLGLYVELHSNFHAALGFGSSKLFHQWSVGLIICFDWNFVNIELFVIHEIHYTIWIKPSIGKLFLLRKSFFKK